MLWFTISWPTSLTSFFFFNPFYSNFDIRSVHTSLPKRDWRCKRSPLLFTSNWTGLQSRFFLYTNRNVKSPRYFIYVTLENTLRLVKHLGLDSQKKSMSRFLKRWPSLLFKENRQTLQTFTTEYQTIFGISRFSVCYFKVTCLKTDLFTSTLTQ